MNERHWAAPPPRVGPAEARGQGRVQGVARQQVREEGIDKKALTTKKGGSGPALDMNAKESEVRGRRHVFLRDDSDSDDSDDGVLDDAREDDAIDSACGGTTTTFTELRTRKVPPKRKFAAAE